MPCGSCATAASRSTDEGFFIAPSASAELFRSNIQRCAAIKAAEHYADRHLFMREPYWGGTLDAQCEDKEGAYAASRDSGRYELTGEDRFSSGRHACDRCSPTWSSGTSTSPGRCETTDSRRGMDRRLAAEQHIDAYG